MKYFKQYKDDGARPFEITADEARHSLAGWWKDEALDDIFRNNRAFRLYTPYCEIWTEDGEKRVPVAGFYGIVG